MHCLIIDDNPKTCSTLSGILEAAPGITQVYKAVQPYLVRSLMACEKIDVIFIRVRLWDFRQFEKLDVMPLIVFLNGGKDKLTTQPGTRVQYSLCEPYHPNNVGQLVEKIGQEKTSEATDFLFLRYDSRFHKTMFSDIEMIERKEGSYVRFYMSYGSWLLPGTLPAWLAKLPPDKFIRVSDTIIVRIEEAVKIKTDVYEYRGRQIPLTFRFASSAKNETNNWPEDL